MAVEPTGPIARVSAGETHALRQQELRPHQSVAEMAFPGDDDPDTGHFAVRDAGGEVIGIATVVHQPPVALEVADPARSWRLRGMATSARHRHQGVGSALVAAATAHVAAHHGTVLWCNARLPAVAFYRRLGFATSGDAWEEPDIGPHVVMWRPLAPPA